MTPVEEEEEEEEEEWLVMLFIYSNRPLVLSYPYSGMVLYCIKANFL